MMKEGIPCTNHNIVADTFPPHQITETPSNKTKNDENNKKIPRNFK